MLPRPRLDLSGIPRLRLIGLSPGSWQTSLGLGSMSRYSAQILISMTFYVYVFMWVGIRKFLIYFCSISFLTHVLSVIRSVITHTNSDYSATQAPCYQFMLPCVSAWFVLLAFCDHFSFIVSVPVEKSWWIQVRVIKCSCIFRHGDRPKRCINKARVARQQTRIVIRYIHGVYDGKMHPVV